MFQFYPDILQRFPPIVLLYIFVVPCNSIAINTYYLQLISPLASVASSSLPLRHLHNFGIRHLIRHMTRKVKLTISNGFFPKTKILLTASNSEERGDWIAIIGKVFKKGQPPKKVNRPSDRKLKNNGTSKSKVYGKKQPFLSYGTKTGFQKRAYILNNSWEKIFGH